MLTARQVNEVVKKLPKEGHAELKSYLEYLKFKYKVPSTPEPRAKRMRLKDLRGILKGYDFSPEVIKQARQEMWGNLGHEPRSGNQAK